jgi:purine nucleosidase
MTRKLLIDTDTASDDAVAIIMALRSPLVCVEGITVVAGNCPLPQAVSNALYTAELCGADTPVYSGAAKPLVRELQLADWFHGKDGLGDHGYRAEKRTAETEPAADAIVRIVMANPGIELVTLGPLTNVATALEREPGIASKISRCVVMGGNPLCEGNVTPAAEFNIYVDPEAARRVFHSGMRIEMVGWQLCRGEAVFGPSDIAELRAMKTKLGHFAVDSNSTAMEALKTQTGETGICLPDPTAMGILLDPELCLNSSEHFVEIETRSEITRGMTVVDVLDVTGDVRNERVWAEARKGRLTHVCWKLDVPRWKELVKGSLRAR